MSQMQTLGRGAESNSNRVPLFRFKRLFVPQRLAVSLLLLLVACNKPTTVPPVSPGPPQVALENLDRPQVQLIEEARKKVLEAPGSAQAWGQLGQTLHAVEYYTPAQECYARAVQLDPKSPRWPYLLGLLQLQDQTEVGLTNLGRAVVLVDLDPDAPRLRLAQALVERGRLDEARPHLDKLLQARPDHPAARLEWARVQLAGQALESAAHTLAPCLTNAFTSRPAMLLLSQIQQRLGQLDSASNLARQAATMPRPFDWPDPYLREVFQWRVDRQKLQDLINQMLMGRRLDQAQQALDKLFAMFPGDAEGLLLLGRLRYQQRQCSEAETAFRQHLAALPQSLNGLTQLALALMCQERWADAAGVWRQAITLKSDFAQAHYNLGLALARSGNAAGAMASYGDALRSNPGDADAHVGLAELLFEAGRADEAQVRLTRALELNPSHAKAQKLRQAHPLAIP